LLAWLEYTLASSRMSDTYPERKNNILLLRHTIINFYY
jgi:hypothetical protein